MAIGYRNRSEMLRRLKSDPRRRWGWGPSALASEEEEEAWEAMQTAQAIQQGLATEADLPEAYGGRPQGTTRRAIRQQILWDAEQQARINEQKAMLAAEEAAKKNRIQELKYISDRYTFESQIEKDLFEKGEAVKRADEKLQFEKFANSIASLDPYSAYSAVTDFLADNPRLLDNPDIQKYVGIFKENADAETLKIANSEERKVQSAISDALRAGLTEQEIEGAKVLDSQGRETYDLGRLRYLTDAKIGSRVAAAEEAKEPKDTRTELEKAQDRLADAKARLGAYTEQISEKDEEGEVSASQRKALADVREAESQLKRLGGDETAKEEEDISEEQINAAKEIARNPKDPRRAAAIRFLNSIGESY